MVGGRARREQAKAQHELAAPSEPSQPSPRNNNTPRPKKRRTPKTAAVMVTCPEGDYKDFLLATQEQVHLKELGISSIVTKKAFTGALLLEISGEERGKRADALAAALR